MYNNHMFYASKRMEVAGSHNLQLPYESKCSRVHGHNWIITVYCCATELTEYGMVMDFKHISDLIKGTFDHANINEKLTELGYYFNPTAENMAYVICKLINSHAPIKTACYKVEVQESEGNVACYEIGTRELKEKLDV